MLNQIAINLRERHRRGERTHLKSVAVALGLRVRYSADIPGRLRWVVVGRQIHIASRLERDDRRWAMAMAIGHWITTNYSNHEVLAQYHHIARVVAACFAYRLLVDPSKVRATDMESYDIAETFGVPIDIVTAYERGSLLSIVTGLDDSITVTKVHDLEEATDFEMALRFGLHATALMVDNEEA